MLYVQGMLSGIPKPLPFLGSFQRTSLSLIYPTYISETVDEVIEQIIENVEKKILIPERYDYFLIYGTKKVKAVISVDRCSEGLGYYVDYLHLRKHRGDFQIPLMMRVVGNPKDPWKRCS